MLNDNTLFTTTKTKYSLEFEIKSSPKILFNYISTTSGLEEWFADEVNEHEGVFSFTWDDVVSQAKITIKKEVLSIRFDWLDEDKQGTYTQIDVIKDDITSDVGLLITDFSEKGDMEQNKMLWSSQIHNLMHILGS